MRPYVSAMLCVLAAETSLLRAICSREGQQRRRSFAVSRDTLNDPGWSQGRTGSNARFGKRKSVAVDISKARSFAEESRHRSCSRSVVFLNFRWLSSAMYCSRRGYELYDVK